MQAGVTCPQCGGSRLLQIAPGYFECLEEIIVGAVPPDATGMTHPIPDIRPCGARFQDGSAGAGPPCALCGLDSVGTCEGCRRRLCGIHGTVEPPFLCGSCVARLAAERKRKEDEGIARRVEDARRREAALDGTSDPAEIGRLLRPGGVDAEHCLGAWDRLVASGALGEPPYELVTVAIKSRRIFGNAAREEGRVGAWRYRDPLQRENEWQLIDEAGTLWDEEGGAPGISKYTVLPRIGTHCVSRGDQFVAVARGGEVVMRVRGGAPGWTLKGGRPMHRIAIRGGERFPIAVLGVIDNDASERPAG